MRARIENIHYLIVAIVVMLLNYVVPYTFLKDCNGLELYFFWTILAGLWILFSLIVLNARHRW